MILDLQLFKDRTFANCEDGGLLGRRLNLTISPNLIHLKSIVCNYKTSIVNPVLLSNFDAFCSY